MIGREGARVRPRISRPPPPAAARARTIPVLGYASVDWEVGDRLSVGLHEQAGSIASECERRELQLLEVVSERAPERGRALERPGLGYALDAIAAGKAQALVVTELSRLSHSLADLGQLLEWFGRFDGRLVSMAEDLDTGELCGGRVATVLIGVAKWEKARLVARTRNGLQAARRKGARGVADDPALQERIVGMRADGMTLQAIADRLNAEGIPTVRGGTKWRPSSVQAAVGYRRQTPSDDGYVR
jgi:DNA invertase Pin-like site-specific DNA recombinase